MDRPLAKYEDHPVDQKSTPKLDQFIDETIIPILSRAEVRSEFKDQFDFPIFRTMIGFIILFGLFQWIMPNTAIGEIANFIAFPLLFLGTIALTLFLYRHQIVEAMLKSRDNFLIRSEALAALCSHLGLEYVPLPGGPSKPMKFIAGLRYCPQIFKDFCALMDDHGGFDDIAEIIRKSGLAVPREWILGSKDSRSAYYEQLIENQQFEDGIKGTLGGIPFSALEWTEKMDDTSRHHLLIILKLPTRLQGRVEFKNKAASWPVPMPEWENQPVRLLSKSFAKKYAVRACDQVEARLIFDPAVIDRLTEYAASDAVCGIAFDDHLVVDLQGRNRFELLDLVTGKWSEDTINATLEDVADLLGFVQTVSTTFALRPLTRSV